MVGKWSIYRIAFFIMSLSHVHGQTIVSDAEMDSLRREADAIVLESEQVCTILNENRAQIHTRQKILVKNSKGAEYGKIWLQESEFIGYDQIKAKITDIQGNIIKKLRKDQIDESTLSPGFILYQKTKNKYFQLVHNSYPYILEYSFRREIKSLFLWPGWYPQFNIPVEISSYKLILKKQVPFNTYPIGMQIDPVKSKEKGDSVYTWQLSNVPPRLKEDFLPAEHQVQMALLFAPVNFELGKSRGSFQSWAEMGLWYYGLIGDRFRLNEEVRREVLDLIAAENDTLEIIRKLYRYLQTKTRYVAIYLDIGGWQPNPAQSVYENGYGDCKDLTILMVAMLKVAGIEAYPALALTRDRGVVYEDFTANQFNHCIAFVPLARDTLWLECTADFLDIREIPYEIEDINTLVVQGATGKIIRTPTAPAAENRWQSTSKVELIKLGTLIIESSVQVSGQQKHFFKSLYEIADSQDKKIVLQKIFSNYIPNLDIAQYQFEEVGSAPTSIRINFNGVYKKAVASVGKRLFVNPNLFNQKTHRNIPDDEKRTFPIRFNFPYQDTDTLQIKIPFGYVLEAAPQPMDLESSFARYKTEYRFEDGFLHYVRLFEYKTNYFHQELYPEFLEFLKSVVKNDQTKFVFVGK